MFNLFSLKLDGDKGEEFARACAYFIEDQSQGLKLIKKKEQSPDFAALMRVKYSHIKIHFLATKYFFFVFFLFVVSHVKLIHYVVV